MSLQDASEAGLAILIMATYDLVYEFRTATGRLIIVFAYAFCKN